MATATAAREIDLTALPWSAHQLWDGELATVTSADAPDDATLQGAVDAAPDADQREVQRDAQRQAVIDAWERLTQIAEFQGTATATQVTAALKDMARYLKALARLHEDELLGR